jgi:hypothetical protein
VDKLSKGRLSSSWTSEEIACHIRLKRLRPPSIDSLPYFTGTDLAISMKLQSVHDVLLQLLQTPLAPLLKRLAVELKNITRSDSTPIKPLLRLTP